VLKKVHSLGSRKAEAQLGTCSLQGVEHRLFFKPTEARTFLHFRLRLKATQSRTSQKKVMEERKEREKGAHHGNTQIPLD